MEPLKKDGFPGELSHFIGKERYSDWKFIHYPANKNNQEHKYGECNMKPSWGKRALTLTHILFILIIACVLTSQWGCSSNEEKKAKHLSNARKYEKILSTKRRSLNSKMLYSLTQKMPLLIMN